MYSSAFAAILGDHNLEALFLQAFRSSDDGPSNIAVVQAKAQPPRL